MKVDLTLACGLYDRTLALQTGTVRPDGIELNYLAMGPGELFRRQARNAEFDVAEFALSTYVILLGQGDRRMVGIPVFPSRKFRHADIYVNTNVGIKGPQDLAGRRVGALEYQQTAAVWLRGVLREQYGVAPSQMEWYFGGYNAPEQFVPRIPFDLPPDIRTVTIGGDTSLNQMLEEGGIDVVIGAIPPRAFTQRSPNVGRLFPNTQEVEAEYYRQTGIFPIMHLVVIKREVYERAPWVAANLYQAFEQAKAAALTRLHDSGTLFCALPWLIQHLEETEALLGPDPFSYGLEKNRTILDTFLGYCFEQGLTPHRFAPEELFVPELAHA